MNIPEQDVIRREQANQNNTDVEKGELVRSAGQSFCACSVSLFMPAICVLALHLHNAQLFYRHMLTCSAGDVVSANSPDPEYKDVPPLRGLSFLDRFLVIWIILAMAIGIILGDFVPSTGPALQKGKFVGVSVPIGMAIQHSPCCPLQVLC